MIDGKKNSPSFNPLLPSTNHPHSSVLKVPSCPPDNVTLDARFLIVFFLLHFFFLQWAVTLNEEGDSSENKVESVWL